MGRKERGDFCRKRESRGWWRGSSFAGGKRESRTRPGLGEVNGWPGPSSRVLLFAFRGLQPARNRRRARFARAKEGGLRRRGPRAETDRARAAQLTETVGRSVGQGRSARRPQDCSPSRFAHKAGRLRFRCGSLGLSPKRPAAASAVSAGKPHPPPPPFLLRYHFWQLRCRYRTRAASGGARSSWKQGRRRDNPTQVLTRNACWDMPSSCGACKPARVPAALVLPPRRPLKAVRSF